MEDMLKLFDAYNRVARIYPALFTLAPISWTAAVLIPTGVSLQTSSAAVAGLIAASLLYALASLARFRGKSLEPKLLATWDGWPTTILLRHRDQTLDSVTKSRYRTTLGRLCHPLVWPSESDERFDPAAADSVYRSATLRLIEHRRDRRFTLLHRENASYGFRRNLLGLKPVALITLAACSIILAVALFVGQPDVQVTRTGAILGFGADLIAAIFWLCVVRPVYVRQAAHEYAIALFRTLEGDFDPSAAGALTSP